MYHRSLKIPLKESFFLFGARGTGKSTHLKHIFREALTACPQAYIDLLSASDERELSRNPDDLAKRVLAISQKTPIVIIDEIQKVPKLLDVVHGLIENHKVNVQFALTGSSARKLRAGAANLLAGRAFIRNLYPLSSSEMGVDFDLQRALTFGTFPKIAALTSQEDTIDYLDSYTNTYLRQEILAEQIVRKAEPFRSFLEIAAAQNTSLINHSAIGRDAGTDPKNVRNFYGILEDTLLGFALESFQTSVRKRTRQASKFYFFDGGLARALANQLDVSPKSGTSYYGVQFEAFVVNEIYKKNEYLRKRWQMRYFQTEAGVEIDLVLEKTGQNPVFIEIKSTTNIREDHVSALRQMQKDFPESRFICVSQDPNPKQFGKIEALPWQMALAELDNI